MVATDGAFAQWLSQAQIAEPRCTAAQRGLLQCAFAFRQRCGSDYYSSRLLSHFLLHCDSGLKVAQIARLVGFSRPTGLPSARRLVQGGHPGSPPPHGRPAPRQAAATLCRPYRRIHADPCRRHPLRHPRLHRPHLGRTRVHGGLVPFLQEVRPRSRHAGPGHGTPTQPRAADGRAANGRASPLPAEQLPAEPCRLDAVPPSQPVPLPPPPFSRRRRTTRNTRGPSC